MPLPIVPVPSEVAPSWKVHTVPVASIGSVAVKITLAPNVDGLSARRLERTVLDAKFTTCESAVETAPL